MRHTAETRWLCPLLAWLLCLVAQSQAGATQPYARAEADGSQGRQTSTELAAGDPHALSLQLKELFKGWKAIPSARVSVEAKPIKTRIDAALKNYVISRLTQHPRSSPPAIAHDLTEAMTIATWESVFGLSPMAASAALKSNPPPPLAYLVEGSGPASHLYAAAFDIGYGNVFSTRVHGFAPQVGGYTAEGAASVLDGAVSNVLPLQAFGAGELRFIIWCLHIGSPDGFTTIAVYRFDGTGLQTLWLRQNVPAAEVRLQQGTVVIESHTHMFSKQGTIFPYERKFYRQEPSGLKRVKIQRWTER